MVQFEVKAQFTLDDLLAYLGRGPEEQAEGSYTQAEWARHFGLTVPKMATLLQEAKRRGLLVVARSYREALDGVLRPVPVYRFVLKAGE